jgi:hypothetical protein
MNPLEGLDNLIGVMIIAGLISVVLIVFILNRFILKKNNTIGENNKIVKKNIIGPAIAIFGLLIPVLLLIGMFWIFSM